MEFAPGARKREVWPGLNEWQKMEITSLQKPITELCRKYAAEINQGQYGLVLGDDVSGRIPTLILSEVIKDTYAQKGYAPPLVRFVSGGYHTSMRDSVEFPQGLEERLQAIEDLTRNFTNELERRGGSNRVLLVTEAITYGMALAKLVEGIRRAGVDLDVAAIGSKKFGEKSVTKQHQVRIESGQSGVPSIYGSRRMTGIRKQQGKPVAASMRTFYPDTNVNAPIRDAREVAHVVAQKIIADLNKKE